jgi:hypothetical protein
MKASKEFVVGKHSIDWISSDFKKYFGDTAFKKRPMPIATVLPRNMTNAEIKKELVTGKCTLGDLLAFLEGDEYRDENFNLFYFTSCLVFAYWYAGYGWSVGAYSVGRPDGWRDGHRVLSPATESVELGSSDTLSLESFDLRLKKLEALVNPKLL